ncbi:MAG TPA: hypothetical protein P5323_03950 [Candidatus Moranbacteria bacterium]|nr:hypothetical protein [Candidatus Moranbacteria bacterium]HSA08603.1 hypothetical protein [Candidatus Moranbacteria bacterium]
MLKKKSFVVIFLIFLLVACDGSEGMRAKEKSHWLKNLEDLVWEIKDPQALQIAFFLQDNAILAEPDKEGVRLLEDSKGNNWVALMPLFEKDRGIGKQWRSLLDVNAAAHFLPEIRTIVLKNNDFSPKSKAIIMLHEGFHMVSYLREPYEEQNEIEYCFEELAAHSFQNRLMILIGKEKYQRLLGEEVRRMKKEAESLGGKPGEIIPEMLNNPELAEIFGKSASKIGNNFIQTSFWIHAAFVFIEKNYKGEVEMQKASFLGTLYKKDGIL